MGSVLATFLTHCRITPNAADLWEGLAASYQALGRHASALKSYTKALELDPQRPYALMSSGALEYMAGAYASAAEKYRMALKLVPQHPAALLGLAEVLLSSACKHAAMGAAGAAAVELSQAAEAAKTAVTCVKEVQTAAGQSPAAETPGSPWASASPTAASRRQLQQQQLQHSVTSVYLTNLPTAWKLLGDILLQQHFLQPIAAARVNQHATSASSEAEDAVAAAVQQLLAGRDLLTSARRAYARALRLNPSSGELWGDLAVCYTLEAKLLQQLQPYTQQSSSTASSRAARAAAVRTARGGLRLSPASSWLWGVLAGAAAVDDPAAAEYAYSRALALDPKAAALWVQLGRLYSKDGAGVLSLSCEVFDQAARSITIFAKAPLLHKLVVCDCADSPIQLVYQARCHTITPCL